MRGSAGAPAKRPRWHRSKASTRAMIDRSPPRGPRREMAILCPPANESLPRFQCIRPQARRYRVRFGTRGRGAARRPAVSVAAPECSGRQPARVEHEARARFKREELTQHGTICGAAACRTAARDSSSARVTRPTALSNSSLVLPKITPSPACAARIAPGRPSLVTAISFLSNRRGASPAPSERRDAVTPAATVPSSRGTIACHRGAPLAASQLTISSAPCITRHSDAISGLKNVITASSGFPSWPGSRVAFFQAASAAAGCGAREPSKSLRTCAACRSGWTSLTTSRFTGVRRPAVRHTADDRRQDDDHRRPHRSPLLASENQSASASP